jgi:hypothetical protein
MFLEKKVYERSLHQEPHISLLICLR